MLFIVLSGFILALAAPGLVRLGRGRTAWLIAVLPLGLLLYFFSFVNQVASGESLLFSYTWVPSLGVNLSFQLDGLSLIFSLLITGIGVLVFIYSGGYLNPAQELGRFYSHLLIFMASMLGLVLADNLIALFVFWELTSISSYLLIGFYRDRDSARAAALQALLITGGGGLALLAGFLLIGQAAGSMQLSELLKTDLLRSSPMYMPILLLILAGAFTKSAQVPFYFWLPNAMEAPTPISAYLHSATMVKAGIYLLARFNPILGGTPLWEHLVSPVGALTMLTGASLALVQTDLKRILAYSTVSALGMLVFMLGMGGAEFIQAAVVFILAHALYKGALFLVAGAVDHETGTRDVRILAGLYRMMPVTAAAAMLAGMSNAGVPPLFGFISKEITYEAVFGEPLAKVMFAILLFTNISFVVTAGLAAFRPFLGKKRGLEKMPHEAPPSLWIGPLLLAAAGLLIGLKPALVAGRLIGPAVTAVIGKQPVFVELELWHGLEPKLILSAVSLICGVGLYLGWERFRNFAARFACVGTCGPERWYEVGMRGLNAIALFQSRILQSGRLNLYILIIIVTTVGLVGFSLPAMGVILASVGRITAVHVHEALLSVIILMAALMVVLTRSMLTAVVMLGVVGYGVALLFLLFSAPDLSMTQFVIETLSVILLVLIFFKLPDYNEYSKSGERFRDAVISISAGGLMTCLVLMGTAHQREPLLLPYYLENSLLLAKGRNIVNVILVDFRGLDTMGEITVLAIAAIGVYSLLNLRSKKEQG